MTQQFADVDHDRHECGLNGRIDIRRRIQVDYFRAAI